jgi:hypothetical protein
MSVFLYCNAKLSNLKHTGKLLGQYNPILFVTMTFLATSPQPLFLLAKTFIKNFAIFPPVTLLQVRMFSAFQLHNLLLYYIVVEDQAQETVEEK